MSPKIPKLKTSFAAISFVFAAFSGVPENFADEIKIDPALNGESQTGREWTDPAAVKKKLAKKIASAFPSAEKLNAKAADDFLRSAENRMLLARWYFLEVAGTDAVKSVTENKNSRKDFFRFLSSAEWLEGFLYSGEPLNSDDFLNYLMFILKKYPNVFEEPMLRKIATATAGEFSRNGWSKGNSARIARRYKFFADSWSKGMLNSTFDELDFWDMRIVCGWKGNNAGYDNETSLRWSRDNVKLPEKGYAGQAIHQLHYRLFSKLGDSVQTGDYYAPFRNYFSKNKSKELCIPAMAFEVGAVCGGVSHFGATGAASNGVPALTMGEPGHCSFAVRSNGKWHPNNSISWDRIAHWKYFGSWETGSWAFLVMLQDMYDDGKNTFPALRKYALAKLFASIEKRKEAIALYEASLAQQPLNYLVWRDYCNFAKEQKAGLSFWMKANDKAIEAFNKKYPDVASKVLEKFVYPNLFPLLKDEKTKLEVVEKFLKNLDALGPSSWAMEKFWDAQRKLLGNASDKFVALGKNSLKDKKEYKTLFDNWAAGNPRK